MGLTIGLGPAFVGSSGGGGGNAGQTIFDLEFVRATCYAVVEDKLIREFPLVDTSLLNSMSSMFDGCTNLQTIPLINTSNVKSMYKAFYNCSNLKTIPLLDTSKVESLYDAFYGCKSLESMPRLNTSKVTDMYRAFYNCSSLKEFPEFDMSNVTNMTFLCHGCSALEVVPSLKTSKATSFANSFNGCSGLKVISSLDALNVATINAATFNNCVSLETCKIKNLKTNLPMSNCLALSKESVLYIFENAQTVTAACTITLHSDVFAQLTDDEIAIATEKGFSVVG